MQAIVTKYLPATNTKDARIKAQCARGSLTLAWDDSLNVEQNHILAAHALKDDFVAEDAAKYGSASKTNPWAKPIVSGCLPSGNYAHVFKA